ncbi:MAG: type II toxin-antitoxin system PemK/MazF family toxin [Candidatus Binatia bacterium]
MKRGEVWWACLPKPGGRRPVLLLSRDSAYAVRTAITVAPLTRTIRDIPVEVPLGTEEGLPAPCVVNLDDIATVPKRLLENRITALAREKMDAVADAIRFALDLP